MAENVGIFTNPKHELYVGSISIHDNPEPLEVMLHIRATVICGSDCHFQQEGAIGDAVVVGERILEHESVGVVINIGFNVNHLKVGDKVAIEPGGACGEGKSCTNGAYYGYAKIKFKCTHPYDSLMRRFVNHPARSRHKIENLAFEEGELLEPLDVGLAGVEQSRLKLGDFVVVAGAGPIGIILAILARAAGDSPLAITGLNPARLELAKELVHSIRTVLVQCEDTT